MTTTRLVWTIFGGSAVASTEPDYNECRLLGSALARSGIDIVCGGYSGIMEAVARGAAFSGGKCTGITFQSFDPKPPNTFLSDRKHAQNIFDRLDDLTAGSSTFVAFRGGLGTLAEVNLVLMLMSTGLLSGERKLILIGSFWESYLENIQRTCRADSDLSGISRTYIVKSVAEIISSHIPKHNCV